MIECTKCGCTESREIDRAQWWGKPVSCRICAVCGTTFRVEIEPGDDKADGTPGSNGDGGVIFQAVRCPKCNCKKCPVKSTRLPVRHHQCSNCGHRFKSVEAD